MTPEDLLFDLKQLTKNRPEGIPMIFFRPRYKVTMNQWRSIMRYLVSRRKVEIFGIDQRIRPILDGFEKNTNSEIMVTDRLIKDIVSELKRCKPSEAYKYCIQKYGYCNPESFTRYMRKMVEFGSLWRDDEDYYSLAPLVRT